MSEHKRAADKAPKDVQAQIRYGRALLNAGDFTRAGRQMDRAVKLSGGSAQALFEVARVHFTEDNYRRSRAACRALKKAHPEHVLYDVCMARAFIVWRRATRAEEPLQAALSKSRDHLEVQFALAEIARLRSDFARADAAYKKVLARDPGYLEAYLGLAASQRLQGRMPEAQGTLDRGVKRYPNHPVLLYELGRLSPARESIPLLERALKVKPKWADAERALARALLAENNAGAADKRLRSLLKRAPKDALALGQLAAAQLALGRPKDAEDSLKRALALQADHPEATLMMARLYAGTDRVEEAFETYRKAAGLRPSDTVALREAAELAHAEKRHVLASAFLQRALSRQPRAPQLHALMGDVLAARGQPTAAAESYQRALDLPAEKGQPGRPPTAPLDRRAVERKLRSLQ